MNGPVLTFAKLAEPHGWVFEHASNDRAIEIAGCRYATLVSADGLVKVGLSPTVLYYHDHRVWWGDSCFDVQPNRVTIAGIVVASEHRRRGLGTAAMESLLAVAREGRIRVILEATPIKGTGGRAMPAARLRRWYASLGFEPLYTEEGGNILVFQGI